MPLNIFGTDRSHKRLLKQTATPHVYELNIDNSSLELFTTCPRQAEYKLVLGRSYSDRAALSFGSAMHTALEHISLGGTYESAVKLLEQHFYANPVDEFEWRNLAFAVESLRKYLEQHKDAMWPLNGEKKFVELGFNVPLEDTQDKYLTIPVENFIAYPRCVIVENATEDTPAFFCESIKVRWTGRIDLVTELDGKIYIVDRKTSSMGGSTFWENFFLSSQMRGYMFAAQHVLQDLDRPLEGIIVDALFGRKPTKTGVAHEFARAKFTYTQESLDEWLIDIIQHIEFFITRLVRGMFPQGTQWCVGKYRCKYHDVCKLPQNMRTNYLMSNVYEENTWDPNLRPVISSP